MFMFDLVAFLLLQLSINLLVKTFSGIYWKQRFRSWSYAFFVILMAVYPFVVNQRLDYDAGGEVKCGMPILAMFLFLWGIGIPATIIMQLLLNKYVLKIKPTNKNIN